MTSDRIQDYNKRREALKKLSDEQLKTKFWQLCDSVVEPLVDLSKTHTSPSIERSVLMRMGIDSFTATGVVNKVRDAGLLGKGAGHAVLKVSQKCSVDIRAAAAQIVANPEILKGLFC